MLKKTTILIIFLCLFLSINASAYTIFLKGVASEHRGYDTKYFSLSETTSIVGFIVLEDLEVDPSSIYATLEWDTTEQALPFTAILGATDLALYIAALGNVPPTSFSDWENKTYTFKFNEIVVGDIFIPPGTYRELSLPVATYDENTKTVSWQNVEFADEYRVRILRSNNVDDWLFQARIWVPAETEYEFDPQYYDILDNGAIITVEAMEWNPTFTLLVNNSIYVTHSAPSSDDILNFFDDSVAAGTLEGVGKGNSANGRLNALRNMVEMAGDLFAVGEIEDACEQLMVAIRKCDGESPPPDFVTGDAAEELYNMIIELMEAIGCE
jgi:hypothetical protein